MGMEYMCSSGFSWELDVVGDVYPIKILTDYRELISSKVVSC